MAIYKTSNKYYRLWLFVLGIIATISYRIIIVLNEVSTVSVKVAWYIGTIGFMWYFAHRYRVQNYRGNLVKEKKLMDKVCQNDLSQDDCEALQYVLKSLQSTKAKWNYVVIFTFSALALIYGIIQDFVL
jgi:hypothetical protein